MPPSPVGRRHSEVAHALDSSRFAGLSPHVFVA
jgi:hypothetical protein